MSLELKTELLMAIEDYKSIGVEERNNGSDITALDNESNDKVLLRVITKPESKSGYIGANTVEGMVAAIRTGDYDKGILIGNRFTKAARRKLAEEGIHIMSEDLMPDISLERLYFVARDLVDNLCKVKCGKVPQKESDCKGHLNGNYSCNIRLISDNSSFHFEQGWTDALQRDILRLMSISHSTSN
ncbi:MAG: hypothetical protein ACFFB3_18620 [Candidatus Hodarchaeota archaeon]